MDAARALMMRGLRNCKDSEILWLDYFKLELVYASQLKQRREVLGLDEGKESNAEVCVSPSISLKYFNILK